MIDALDRFLKRYHLLSILIALLAVSNIVSFIPSLGNFYYLATGVALILLLMTGGLENVRWPYALFLLICVISIVFNDIPPVFQPWMRFIIFMLAIALLSPLLQSDLLRRFRCETFTILMYLQIIIVIASFFAPFFGLETSYRGIGNRGVTDHLMILGPVAGMSMLFCIYQVWIQKSRSHSVVLKWFYIVVAFMSFALVISSTSRIAIVATGAGGVALILYKARFRMGPTLMYAFLLAAILGGSYPFWNKYSIEVVAKQEAAIMSGGTFATREKLWQERLEEFRTSPYIGIGFAAVEGVDDTKSVTAPTKKQGYRFRGMNRHNNMALRATAISVDGKVETGSGWLLVLSMNGLAGVLYFIWFFFLAYRRTIIQTRRYDREPFILLGSTLTLVSFHMLAEGYTLAAGSYMFFVLWLTLGTIDAWPKRLSEIHL